MTSIIAIKLGIESKGGNFAEAVRAAPVYVPEAEKPIEIKTPAQFKKEEELILRFTDQLGIGEKMYGVLQGTPCGTACRHSRAHPRSPMPGCTHRADA